MIIEPVSGENLKAGLYKYIFFVFHAQSPLEQWHHSYLFMWKPGYAHATYTMRVMSAEKINLSKLCMGVDMVLLMHIFCWAFQCSRNLDKAHAIFDGL